MRLARGGSAVHDLEDAASQIPPRERIPVQREEIPTPRDLGKDTGKDCQS